jgi:predicted nucleic acid-binding protein
LRIADSSYIVEGLLKRSDFLEEDFLLTVDLAVYETVNSIWKHQCLLKDLKDGSPYVSVLQELIESGRIRVIRPGKELMEKAYSLATKHRRPIYDTVFVAIALQLGLELATFDKHQSVLLHTESQS